MFKYKEGVCFLGRTLELEASGMRLAVTLDVGPRIISLGLDGGENLMFEDVGDAVSKDCSTVYGKGAKWHIYGGHRLWLSPENESTYYPDNGRVSYKITEQGAIFTPSDWNEVGVRPSLEVRFLQESCADIVMSMTNLSDKPKELCLWALTVLKSGGVLEADLPVENTGYLPNRNLVLWHYTDIKDARLTVVNDKLIVKSSVSAAVPLKVGYYNNKITTRYTFGNVIFTKSVDAPRGVYPDFGCNVETYTSNLIHEVETLSPITTAKPGDTVVHTERWKLSRR